MFRSDSTRAAGARRRFVPTALAAASMALAASALQAQTLVPNPHLNADLPPWQPYLSTAPDPGASGVAPVWQATPDVDGSASSGSARVRLSPLATNAKSGLAQCFNFSAPTSVNFVNYGMAFWAPAAVLDGSMSANVEIRLFSGAGCSGFLSGGSQGQILASGAVPATTWYRLSDTNFVPAGAPVMAASAEIRGYLRQSGTTTQSDYGINLDNFVLVLNSTTPVELIRFQID
jgi:hypothetical protein